MESVFSTYIVGQVHNTNAQTDRLLDFRSVLGYIKHCRTLAVDVRTVVMLAAMVLDVSKIWSIDTCLNARFAINER